MIAFFPEPYEDELAYSWLARYHARSGHFIYLPTAEELFERRDAHPNPEFVSALTEEAKAAIGRYMTMEQLIVQHTMFPYYARFLSAERRAKALEMLVFGNAHYKDALRLTRYKTEQRSFLRYCPICAAEDREMLGETYWHRAHQINGIHICPKHRCRLQDSSVGVISKKSRYGLCHAEEVIPCSRSFVSCIPYEEDRVAEYVVRVFASELAIEKNIALGSFLQSKIVGTSYKSYDDFWHSFSRRFSAMLSSTLSNTQQLQLALCGQNSSTYDICLLAIFLGISAEELVSAEQPTDMQPYYAYQIDGLRSQGKTYPQIAMQLGLSFGELRAIRELKNG